MTDTIIDWNEFEQGFVLESIEGGRLYSESSVREEGEYYIDSKGGRCRKKSYTLHTRPKPAKLIYTQEMHDKGLMPEVGMMIASAYTGKEYEVLFKNDNSIVYTGGSGRLYVFDSGEIKPIIAKTDKEKTFEAISKSWNKASENANDTITGLLNDIIAGNIPSLEYTGGK